MINAAAKPKKHAKAASEIPPKSIAAGGKSEIKIVVPVNRRTSPATAAKPPIPAQAGESRASASTAQ